MIRPLRDAPAQAVWERRPATRASASPARVTPRELPDLRERMISNKIQFKNVSAPRQEGEPTPTIFLSAVIVGPIDALGKSPVFASSGLRHRRDLLQGRRLETGSRQQARMPLLQLLMRTHQRLPFGKSGKKIDLRRKRQIGKR